MRNHLDLVSSSLLSVALQREVDEMKEIAEQHASEAAEAQKHFSKAQRQIEKLKALLESERSKPSKSAKPVSYHCYNVCADSSSNVKKGTSTK